MREVIFGFKCIFNLAFYEPGGKRGFLEPEMKFYFCGLLMKKIFNILVCILLILPLFSGIYSPLKAAHIGSLLLSAGYQKTCGMDSCSPNLPRCPLCPSSNSIHPYIPQETRVNLEIPVFSFIFVRSDTLSDQGVPRSIFRPPILTS